LRRSPGHFSCSGDVVVGFKRLLTLSFLAARLTFDAALAEPSSIGGTSGQFDDRGAASGAIKRVVRVIDGDTIVVGPNEKVRLIGVDTPETVHPKKAVACFGKEAKQFTRDAVEGKNIRLVLDKVYAKRRHKDRYGRTLAYAYLDDGRMLNSELIRQGYAHAYTRFPFRYLVEFRALEHEARHRAVGLWSNCALTTQRR
jgi:endonuclease YncB( thermonuclease family)